MIGQDLRMVRGAIASMVNGRSGCGRAWNDPSGVCAGFGNAVLDILRLDTAAFWAALVGREPATCVSAPGALS